ncbi:MAG: ribonuclease III [Bacteroidaceae bacterium]|nr:ribonuclease III [Bacteroidaceae bacterium]
MLGFYPRHIKFYKEALMHSSMSAKSEKGRPLNNERLEFLGDAVLDAAVGDIVFRHFQGKREGFLTNARSKIVQRETLGRIAVEMGLDKLIVHTSRGHQNHNSYLAGNAFEALVGAIYLDRGYKACLDFLEARILRRYINIDKLAYKEMNFKSKLLEWCQKHHLHAQYKLVDELRTREGSPMFKSTVWIEDIECGTGQGFSKKESQQMASKSAIKRIEKDPALKEKLKETGLSKLNG